MFVGIEPYYLETYMVNVAEWFRHWIVVPVHVGSNPTVHPKCPLSIMVITMVS